MTAIVKAPNDVGGEPAGPIDTVDHPKADWEHQVDGMLNLIRGMTTVDELRRHMEGLGSELYHQLGYTERMVSAIAQMFLRKGTITSAELARKLEEIDARGHAL
jgi:hypothetical protein